MKTGTISLSLLAGMVFAALTIPADAYSTPQGYTSAFASSSFLLCSLATGIYCNERRNTWTGQILNSRIFWFFILFVTGIYCYSTRSIISPLSSGTQYFSGAHCVLSDWIDSVAFIHPENNALLKALILGDKTGLSAETLTGFRNAGAAHLLALSGMHLGIIYLIINKLLLIFGNSIPARKIRSVIIILATGAYTLLCGAGASLVRAWLFILLNETAKLLDRPQPLQQVFCTALTIQLLIRPESICEAGFQLSYLAMTGIVFLWPFLKGLYRKVSADENDLKRVSHSLSEKIWDAATLCISCQIFTAPLSWLYFGTFPKYFLITNMVAAPLMILVMASGISALALSSLLEGCPQILIICLEWPLSALRWLIDTIASIP